MSQAPANPPPAKKAAGGRKLELPEELKVYKGVWVIVEQERGKVHTVSYELLGEARKLADKLGVEVGAVILGAPGPFINEISGEAISYGADVVYTVLDPVLAEYRTEPYSKGMTDVVNTFKPEIVLLGASTLGRDLAGAIATTLLTGLTADCTELDINAENRSLAATRPTFGGTLLCTIQTLAYRPQMATIRPRVMQMPEKDLSRSGRIIEVTPNLARRSLRHQGSGLHPRPRPAGSATGFRRHHRRRRQGLAEARELQADLGSGRGAGCGSGCFPSVRSGGLGVGSTGRSARPARRSVPSSTSPPASPVRSSIASAAKTPT